MSLMYAMRRSSLSFQICECVAARKRIGASRTMQHRPQRNAPRVILSEARDRFRAKAVELPRGRAILRSSIASLRLPQDDSHGPIASLRLPEDDAPRLAD